MFFWDPLKTVFFTGRRFFNFDFFCTVQTFVWIHGNYSVVKVSKSKKEKKIPFSVKFNNRDFLNHVVVPNVRFVLRTVSTVLYCRTVGICTVHIRILYSTVNTSIYEYILYCIALYLCQGNDHIFRPCFLQYNILHCTLYSVLYTWGPVLWSRLRNQLKMKLHCFNPNIRDIGEKSPTFVQNNFTPWCFKLNIFLKIRNGSQIVWPIFFNLIRTSK